MSTTRANMWFILPRVEISVGGLNQGVPKYLHNNPDVGGYSGIIVEETTLQGEYNELITQFPGNKWYIVRVYASEGKNQQAIANLSDNQDAVSLTSNQSFIVDVINNNTGLTVSTLGEVNQSYRLG